MSDPSEPTTRPEPGRATSAPAALVLLRDRGDDSLTMRLLESRADEREQQIFLRSLALTGVVGLIVSLDLALGGPAASVATIGLLTQVTALWGAQWWLARTM